MIKISQRLQVVANMVKSESIVADIGTDHGYLPIYLVQSGKAKRIIAMDINKGPLNKAASNIKAYGLDTFIETRLSDGLYKLEKDEASTITICGMGGNLISNILENGRDKISENTQLILSPQSEISIFRENLRSSGFTINQEVMLEEDGKFYNIMECKLSDESQEYNAVHLKYGFHLLHNKSKVLKNYLIKEQKKLEQIRINIEKLDSDNVSDRVKEIDCELQHIQKGLEYYEM